MTVYNSESYINEAIDSVLNQTISDFEFLIIDDGSTDNSVAIIKKYRDKRINLVIKEINTGLIDSLNLGLQLAKGKYIARMDSDDINLSNRFEKQLAILEGNPEIHVCGCWLKAFGEKDHIIKHKEFHDEIVANMLIHCSMTMGSVMFEKKAFEGYQFNKEKKHVEDYDYWTRIAWECKFYNIQEVLYCYRKHKTQISALYLQKQIEGDIAIKLFLFKKLNYNTKMYSDILITKMLLLNECISIKEFSLYNKWISNILYLNKDSKVYSQKEFEKVLKILKEKTIYSLYFKKSTIGITKKWRLKSLLKLDFKDLIWILRIKGKEILKKYRA